MKKVNLHEAQSDFAKLIELVLQGQEIIICSAGQPIAKLVSFTKTRKRKPGSWERKVVIEEDFDILPPDFLDPK